MKQTAIKLAASIFAFLLFCFLLGQTHNDLFFFLLMAAFISSVMYWIDLGRSIRELPASSRMVRSIGILLGVPQAMLGIVSVLIGLALIVWALYNTFIERQAAFSGGLFSFGIGPALVAFGYFWLADSFRGNAKPNDPPNA